jgi:protease-4
MSVNPSSPAPDGSAGASPSQPGSPAAAPPPKRGRSLLGVLFTFSFLLNLLLLCGGVVLLLTSLFGSSSTLEEHVYAGKSSAKDKVAVVRLDGVIMEGLLSFVHKQIDAAAKDDHVKAVVLRINSPGGTITASDDLHHRLVELRDGNPEKKTQPKKLIASMGAIAASGGYYVAMPAETIVAERTTITGSIGVFAALPNVHELADRTGVEMIIIKRGEVKDSGSMFKKMEPEDEQVWDDMVANAYKQFREVVEEGRPKLRGTLLEELPRDLTVKSAKDKKTYVRRRADGGIFTAPEAKDLGLIDEIDYLDRAIQLARKAASLGDDSKVITYERPTSLAESVLGIQTPSRPAGQLDLAKLANGLQPRLWYLAPGCELTGFLSAAGPEQ